MRIMLESTTKVVELNGVPARIWEGATESGIPIYAYVTRMPVDEQERRGLTVAPLAYQEQFDVELNATSREAAPALQAIALRVVL
jgi:hypothetical protein